MSTKYTLASSTTAGDRLLNVGLASKQLSDGSLVELVRDPTVADPNSVTLQVVPAPAHTTPQVIATLNAVTTLGTGTFWLSGKPQSLTLAIDNLDNIFVVGCYGGVTGGGINVVYQGFTKGSGLTWTPSAANSCSSALSGSPQLLGFAAVWCNTNGAGGHLAIVVNTSTSVEGFFSLNAATILAGAGQHGTYVVSNPACLGFGLAATAGSNIDIATDGLGATSGFVISSNTLTQPQLSPWGLSSSGVLTTGSGTGAILTSGTLSATTKLRCIRYRPGHFAIIYPSATTAGCLSVTSVSAAQLGANEVDTDTTGSFPQPSASLSWDVAPAAPNMKTIWIYGWKTGTPTTMVRYSFTFDDSDTTTRGSVVSDDTSVGSGAGNTTIRVVTDPVDYGHVDWETYDVVSPFSLLGDFSALPTAPNVPVLASPANGAALGLSTGGAMTWSPFASPILGDAEVSTAFQRQVSGGAIRWWDGVGTGGPLSDGWLTTETYFANTADGVTFASGHWTASSTYTWSVAVKGSSGVSSGYSTPFTVTVLAPPTAPTLTAVYDPVLNRTTLVIDGSVSSAPIGSIEFSTDGGTTWAFVIGATAIPNVYPGPVTVYHYENSQLVGTQFRARNWSPIPLNYSAYVNASVAAAAPSTPSYWLFDPTTGAGLPYLMTPSTREDAIDEQLTVHRPAGRQNPITVADAIIGPNGLATGIVTARDGQATWVTQNVTDQLALIALLQLQRELFNQSPVDAPIWIRRLTATASDVAVDSTPWATRFENAITWVTVDRPAP